jgi:hypothetical protein
LSRGPYSLVTCFAADFQILRGLLKEGVVNTVNRLSDTDHI